MNVRELVQQTAVGVSHGAEGRSASAVRQLPPTPRGSIRILTYNILFGRRWTESLAVIRDADADVICLQEVVPQGSFYEPAVSLDRIADDIGMPHDSEFLWGRGKKRLGNMTFARDGVDNRRILRTWPTPAYGMANRVRVGGDQLTIVNVHLSPMLGPPLIMFLPSELLRLKEAAHLTRWARAQSGPIVAAGDFNTFALAPGCRRMNRDWRDARRHMHSKSLPTRPTYGIPFVIDHVFVRGAADVCEYAVLPGGGSDHRAVLATIKLPDESAFATGQSPV